jgi:sialate O-acetylesterase
MKSVLFLFSLVCGLHALTSLAVEMPAVFSDGMVLQRQMAMPVWGTAEPGEKVTVKFRQQEKTATADATSGAWRVELDALKLGEPGTLAISGSKSPNALTFSDVLVGDVWVGSGQSNMAGRVASYAKNDPTLAKARDAGPYPQIRLFHIGKPPGAWQQATPENIDAFSALLFAFGEALHAEVDVPIGLMLGAVGGTPSGYWLSEEAFRGDAAVQAEIAKFAESYDHAAAMKRFEEVTLPKWQEAVERIEKQAKENPDPDSKKQVRKPRKPSPPVKAGESSRGGQQGGLYERYIRPAVGYGIRGVLWDQGEAGSGILGAGQFATMQALIAGWRNEWAQGEFPFLFVQKPSGGGCAFATDDPVTREADKFSALAPTGPNGGGDQRWEYVRLMNATPNAYMVAACDLGGMIHPINKWGYGQRSARVALGAAYEKDGLVWSGPNYREHKVEDGGKVRVQFDHVGGGLKVAHSDSLQGFELAGADGKFVWADAVIDGDSVVVSSEKVAQPKAVRFAFSKVRSWANLFNAEGLPALAFSAEVAE